MTEIFFTLNNFNENKLFSLFPVSNDCVFIEKKVFKFIKPVLCSCGTKMVDNGHDFVRKK